MYRANGVLRGITTTLVVLALVFSSVLLAEDAGMSPILRIPRGVISAMPLLLVGAAFLIVQMRTRPRSKELLKNVLLAATFILWGIVQLMPLNAQSIRLSSLVVALYVLDLAWAILVSVTLPEKSPCSCGCRC